MEMPPPPDRDSNELFGADPESITPPLRIDQLEQDGSDAVSDRDVLLPVIERSMREYGSPTALLREMLFSTPDDRLIDFAKLLIKLEAICEGTSAYRELIDEDLWPPKVLNPYEHLGRAMPSADGLSVTFPMADRYSLEAFLSDESIVEMVDEFCRGEVDPEYDGIRVQRDETIENPDPAIGALRGSYGVFEEDDLMEQIETTWLNSPNPQLSIPKILQKVIESTPDDKLIPLLALLQAEFARSTPNDGRYYMFYPELPSLPGEQKDGIIWSPPVELSYIRELLIGAAKADDEESEEPDMSELSFWDLDSALSNHIESKRWPSP